MKGITPLRNLITKLSFILLVSGISGCNSLKYVPDNAFLLEGNKIYIDQKRVKNDSLQNLIIQQPNTTIFGYPLKLNLHNIAPVNRKEGDESWLERAGETPVVIEAKRTRQSVEKLKAFYESNGYFNAQIQSSLLPSRKKKKASVRYDIHPGYSYEIDTISTHFASPLLDSLYRTNQNESFIKKGARFTLPMFEAERDRMTQWYKNNGLYNFQSSAISFKIERDTLIDHLDRKLNVHLTVENPRGSITNESNSKPYNQYLIGDVNVYLDVLDTEKTVLDSFLHNGIKIYYKDRLRYKPKAITDAIYFSRDSLYREINRQRTYRQISNLSTFKYPSISFNESEKDNKIDTAIYLFSRDKYTSELSLDVTHSNIQKLGLAFSSSLMARNIFKGAEILSISARGSVGLLGDAAVSSQDYISEFGLDLYINIPSLWFPFVNLKRWIPNYMLPKTRVSTGRSIQTNIGLDKQTFNAAMGYNWAPSDYKKHSFSLLDVQYVQNLNPERFFSVYTNTYDRLNSFAQDYATDSMYQAYFERSSEGEYALLVPDGTTGFTQAFLQNNPSSSQGYTEVNRIEERRKRLTENNLISTSHYTYTKNNKKGITDPDFYQFRLKIESAGNVLSALSKPLNFKQNNEGALMIAGVPFSQYVKSEIDFIKHWHTGLDKMLAFRSFIGIAIPYGNSQSVPFARSYFAGGSNDNRAWNAYELGPGRTYNRNDFNEANFKIAFNLEYRFPLAGNLKGALFADAGNIWNTLDNIEDPAATFVGLSSLKDIALGSGLGIRYDFSYFVFRVDVGFKTYNPTEPLGERWFKTYNFANSVINIGINYPF